MGVLTTTVGLNAHEVRYVYNKIMHSNVSGLNIDITVCPFNVTHSVHELF